MPTSTYTATDAELIRPSRSHTVSGHAGVTEKEELYPTAVATWRGKRYRVELSADRYRHSASTDDPESWTNWRVYARDAYELRDDEDPAENIGLSGKGSTDTARQRLGDACIPLVEAWLESHAYYESRRRAFRWFFRQELRQISSSYTIERVEQMLTRYGFELDREVQDGFREALALAVRFWEIVDGGRD